MGRAVEGNRIGDPTLIEPLHMEVRAIFRDDSPSPAFGGVLRRLSSHGIESGEAVRIRPHEVAARPLDQQQRRYRECDDRRHCQHGGSACMR